MLTRKTIHPSLAQTVFLLTVPSYVCKTCERASSGLTFYSEGDNFCVKCILWPRNEFSGYGGFESIHHRHELTIKEVDKVNCFMCGRDCTDWNYECNKCSTYFHKSCVELPAHIQHPIHPHHPLTLTAFDLAEEVKCKLCLGTYGLLSRYSRSYRCESCCFSLDSHCASLSSMSFVEYQGHPHLLAVTDSLYKEFENCNKCDSKLPQGSPVIRCAECQFSLHLECGPLPCFIKDPRHVHPLTLHEYYVEDNMSDEFACHICEEKRDPMLAVYICTQGCPMVCEVKCVLTEVVASLRGQRGALELDTMYPKVACKLITSSMEVDEYVATDVPVFSLKKLIESAKPDFESELLEGGNNKPNSGVLDLRGDNSSSQSEFGGREYHYSRKALKDFVKNIEGNNQGKEFDREFKDIFSQFEGSRVEGDYLLPKALHSVYDNLFAKHAIFSPECNLSHDRKRLIVFYICTILHDMRMIKVVEVSAERIESWSSALRAVGAMYRCNGLDLSFLFEHQTRIAEDHYMVQAVGIIENKFSELCKTKEDLSEREKKLMGKLAETRRDIEENEEELGSFRAYRATQLEQGRRRRNIMLL